MRKIKEENIKVGDYIFIINTIHKEKIKNRRFILKILSEKGGLKNTYYWTLKETSKKPLIFAQIKYKDNYTMLKEDWESYEAYKLNKEEIGKFNKLLIIDSLENEKN